MPDTFDHDKIVKLKSDSCQYCKRQLGTFKAKQRNCLRCGACVCEKCSENKEQLSRSDPKEYRVCNMCYAIRKNKPIIIFYNDLDKANKMRLDGLADRKNEYQDRLVKDNAEIRHLKRELEEHQKQYDAEIEELVNELASVRDEQKSNKASINNLNTLLQKEEDTILKKQREMNDHEMTLQQLKIKQENTEQKISDVSREVEAFLSQYSKYQKSTQLNTLMND